MTTSSPQTGDICRDCTQILELLVNLMGDPDMMVSLTDEFTNTVQLLGVCLHSCTFTLWGGGGGGMGGGVVQQKAKVPQKGTVRFFVVVVAKSLPFFFSTVQKLMWEPSLF